MYHYAFTTKTVIAKPKSCRNMQRNLNNILGFH